MSATKEAPAKAPANFSMPRPCVGEWVLHRLNRGGEVSPALVQKVGEKTVSLLIFPEFSRSGMPKDGVRHQDDPDYRPERDDAGCWEFSDLGKWSRQSGFEPRG